jgi:hypothetical protein
MRLIELRSSPLIALLITLVGGCGSNSDEGGNSLGGPPATGPITKVPEGWNEMLPGGATTCAHGDPYRFWVRPGKVNRVVIDFRGGGACWDTLTCAIAGTSVYSDKADPEPWMKGSGTPNGIYDHDNAENPFKDWHHVYLAYCTGDVHWGDSTQTYAAGQPIETTIQHKGAVNAKAVLDWVYENVPKPDKVFVTGCSAGGYGAALWAAHVRGHYGDAKNYEFADSAAGIITDDFFQKSFPAWNATANFPAELGIDTQTFTKLSQLYTAFGKTYPDTFLSEYNTFYDETQSKYYVAMGGKDANEWSTKMQASIAEIEATTPSFRAYLAANYKHCILPDPEFYTVEVGGRRLVDWIEDVIKDKDVEKVSCTTSDCGQPKP